MLKSMFIAAVLGGLASSATAQAADTHRFDQVRQAIQYRQWMGGVSGVAVAVAQNGKIVWEEGFGWADRAKQVPVDRDTMFSLASISKPITATALMTLVQQGKVDLDKPANAYLGAAKLVADVGNADDATVRRLANHTSGLAMHYQFFYDDEPAKPSMDESIRRYGHITALPGERLKYSNFGFGVIDYIVERQAGRPFEDYVDDAVFKPLNMTRSVMGRPDRFGPNVATRYMPEGQVVPYYDFDHPGASAAWTSAHDLVRFGMFFLGDKLPEQSPPLTPASVAEMLKPTSPGGEGKDRFGVSWVTEKMGDLKVVNHTGGMAGVATGLYMLPDKDAVIVILTNGSFDTGSFVPMIAKALEPDAGAAKVYAADSGLAGHWRGTVRTYQGQTPIEVKVEQGRTLARLGSGPFKDVDARIDDDGFLQLAALEGDIGTDDARRYPYLVNVELKLRGASLVGNAAAQSKWMPGRVGNNLDYPVELKKVGG